MAKWGASVIQRVVGYDFTRPEGSMKFTRNLERVRSFVPTIGTVIDVGASDGSWSESVKPAWPDANYLLVEAQDCHAAKLREYTAANPKVSVEYAACSDRTGSLHFLTESGPFGGSASHEPFPQGDISVPCVSIDDALTRRELPGPYLIKLDTHGHEREILSGAATALTDTALLCIEAYTFGNFGRMRFWDLCSFLEDRGFLPAAMSDPLVRPSDELLWQMDFWFIPASHPVYADTTWDSRASR